MKRGGLVILIFLFAIVSAFSQTSDFRRNIGLDSLVSIIQKSIDRQIYYNKDESGILTFTVNVSSATLMDDVSRMLCLG